MKKATVALLSMTALLMLTGLKTGCSNPDESQADSCTNCQEADTGEGQMDVASSPDDSIAEREDVAVTPDIGDPDPCLEICAGVECGQVESCECGTCGESTNCVDGQCICLPDCEDKACGPDGCGGGCGVCPEGMWCGLDATCYEPDCLDGMTFGTTAKVNQLTLGKGGHPGQALDVDGDPDTCAPVNDCEAGLDNQFSKHVIDIQTFIAPEDEIAKAIEDGSIMLLIEMDQFVADGSKFTINLYVGDAVADKETCNWQSDPCEYLVKIDSFDSITCLPLITFENATINGDTFTAGGPESLFILPIPLGEGLNLQITVNMAQITGTVAFDDAGALTITNGIVGGAIRKDKLLETIMMLPKPLIEQIGIGPETLANMVDMLIETDIDTDDDGEPDATSIGLPFNAIPATITGLAIDQ
jgi:hypothetical protein